MIVKTAINWHEKGTMRVNKQDLLNKLDRINSKLNLDSDSFWLDRPYEGRLVLHTTEKGLYMLARLHGKYMKGGASAITIVPLSTRDT